MSIPSELDLGQVPATVCVVDTSVLIDIKHLVPIGRQWELLTGLGVLLRVGVIAFPTQVRAEMVGAQYPDAPGAWVAGCRGTERYLQPGDHTLGAVLAVAPHLIDPLSETEIADPYVLAMALEIRTAHPTCRVVIATKDCVDRMPVKTSLASACERFSVEWWKPPAFIEWVWPEVERLDAVHS